MPEDTKSENITRDMEKTLKEMESQSENFDHRKNMLKVILKTFKPQIIKVVIWGLMADL